MEGTEGEVDSVEEKGLEVVDLVDSAVVVMAEEVERVLVDSEVEVMAEVVLDTVEADLVAVVMAEVEEKTLAVVDSGVADLKVVMGEAVLVEEVWVAMVGDGKNQSILL